MQIAPVFQPIKDLITKQVFAYEALARGANGEKPATIFYRAKREKQLRDVDLLCIKTALNDAPLDINVFINIFPATLIWAASNGILNSLPAGRVFLEIVEMNKSADIFGGLMQAVETLRDIGYGIVIDDVSSGYDRLRMIAELRPSFIKIDRHLVAGCHQAGKESRRKIIHRLHQIAVDNGAHVIAEGIEHPHELLTLDDLGIPYGQGFLLGYPEREPWNNNRRGGVAVV